ncbi:HpcH/HpaI aldolase/citrate lyase family protein [Pararhizobium mangrovi]|uniref:HpcH/HpaI aldolase/citrate lyase domain-containing protein n=1 Tax=Pararhizobium mangrovi TaxID=2590452 RepID=A0A506UEU9_9HYPH|nr:aldolase/citrate lyase family protein [Pararhizobium mangrovi]TPW31309.1 hypothetical protein FJU11_03695 [Pararhizobium mangrovi]
MRSVLYISLGEPSQFEAAHSSGADWLLADLEMREGRDRAVGRERVATFLKECDRSPPYRAVRIAPVGEADCIADLCTIMAGRPDSVVLTGATDGRDVQHLAVLLGVQEAEHGLRQSSTRIVVAIDNPAALVRIEDFAGKTERLAAFLFDRETLRAAIGGSAAMPFAAERIVLGAAVASVPAIDAPSSNDALASACQKAIDAGFSAKMASDPIQIEAINRRFTPGLADVAWAERVIALLHDRSTAHLNGQRIGALHRSRAETILRASACASVRRE